MPQHMACEECGGWKQDRNAEQRIRAFQTMLAKWKSRGYPGIEIEQLCMIPSRENLQWCFQALHEMMASGEIRDTSRAYEIKFPCSQSAAGPTIGTLAMMAGATKFAETYSSLVIGYKGRVYLVCTVDYGGQGDGERTMGWLFSLCRSQADGSVLEYA